MPVISYLKLRLPAEGREAFQRDFEALLRLVTGQPGFLQAEVLRPAEGPEAYVVISEWETVEHIRAWERAPEHKAVIDGYKEELVHRRFVPWQWTAS